MLIFPAIDIIKGRVVRLERGDFETAKAYPLSPLEYAKKWESEGAAYLHIVDLDGARSGSLQNFDVIEDIIRNIGIKAEVGGGIRDVAALRQYMDAGAARVVLSTKIIEDVSFLQDEYVKSSIKRIAASIDFKRMEVKASSLSIGTGSSAWMETVDISVSPFIRYLASQGIEHINFSDISRDGTMMGPDSKKILSFLAAAKSPGQRALFFTYAGGISSLSDLKTLAGLAKTGEGGVDAVVVGKALYENKFMLKDAIQAVG
jgi:phosphoribosylformimino-5-aminoimidazole carboxamide ribotide isomerase